MILLGLHRAAGGGRQCNEPPTGYPVAGLGDSWMRPCEDAAWRAGARSVLHALERGADMPTSSMVDEGRPVVVPRDLFTVGCFSLGAAIRQLTRSTSCSLEAAFVVIRCYAAGASISSRRRLISSSEVGMVIAVPGPPVSAGCPRWTKAGDVNTDPSTASWAGQSRAVTPRWRSPAPPPSRPARRASSPAPSRSAAARSCTGARAARDCARDDLKYPQPSVLELGHRGGTQPITPMPDPSGPQPRAIISVRMAKLVV